MITAVSFDFLGLLLESRPSGWKEISLDFLHKSYACEILRNWVIWIRFLDIIESNSIALLGQSLKDLNYLDGFSRC